MRKLFYTTASIWLIYLSYGLSQNVEWIKKINLNPSYFDKLLLSIGKDLVLGQVYYSGKNILIDSIELTPKSNSGNEFYFGKFGTNNGKLISLTQSLSRNQRGINDIITDNFGNTWICGYYNNNLILDTLVLRSNGVGMFVVKYDSSGKIIWTPEITYTPNSIIQACSMAKSEDGSLYITGYHKDSEVILSNDTIKDCSGFIVKYNEYGNLKWLRKVKGSLSNQNFIANMSASIIEKDNGIIFYFNTMGNGSIELENQRYSFKDDNVFIASLNENGNVKWAKVLDTKYKIYGSDIEVINDNIFLSGLTNGNFVTDTAYRIDTYSPFIIAFDNSGKTIWNKFITNCQNISITTNGVELISAFDFNKTIHFDNRSIVPNTSNLPNLDTSSDICISVINPNDGITKSVYKYGDKGSENFPSILFNNGYLYLFANLIEVIKNKNDSSKAEFGSFLAKIKLPTLSVNLEDKNNLQVLESDGFVKIKMPAKPHKFLLSCFNSMGEKLFTKDILPLTGFIELDKSTFTNGKYFCTIEHDGITETISFVIQK